MDQSSLALAIECILGTLAAIGAGSLVFTRRSADGDEDVTDEVASEQRSRLDRLRRYSDS
jgi:hypothetical protein